MRWRRFLHWFGIHWWAHHWREEMTPYRECGLCHLVQLWQEEWVEGGWLAEWVNE